MGYGTGVPSRAGVVRCRASWEPAGESLPPTSTVADVPAQEYSSRMWVAQDRSKLKSIHQWPRSRDQGMVQTQ
jgi:hypothetical protein